MTQPGVGDTVLNFLGRPATIVAADGDGRYKSSSGLWWRWDGEALQEDDLLTEEGYAARVARLLPELAALPCWVAYRLAPSGSRPGKTDKFPIDPHTGRLAKADDHTTWSKFAEAAAFLAAHPDLAGLGFQLGESPERRSGIVGVDLDDCFDPGGNLAPWAATIVERLGSYTETSPSGRGLRVFCRGELPPGGRRRGGVELYEHGRFLTVTGNVYGEYRPVADRPRELAAVHAAVFGEPAPSSNGAGPAAARPSGLDDAELLEKARSAANGEKFSRLWAGDASGYASRSEGDLALCNMLAFWTGGDEAQIDRLFRQSGLMRAKWDERHSSDGRTYGQATIDKAIAGTAEGYEAVGEEYSFHRSGGLPASNGAAPVLQLAPESGAALYAEHFEPLVFLVDGLLAKGHLCVIGGRPKSGKTWLMLQAAQAIDTGRAFLGRATRKSRLLYVDLESGRRRAHQRLHLLGWKPAEASFLFQVAHFDGDGAPGPGLAQLEALAPDFDCIVVDTLIATLSGRANENDNVQMGGITGELSRIAHDHDVAIVLVHHTGKSGGDDPFNLLRGASAIRGGYDVGLLLERKQDEREALLHVESRDFEGYSLTIQQAAGGAGWEALGDGRKLDEIRAGKRAYEAMRAHGDPLTADELAKLLGISRQAANAQLLNLERDGYATRAPEAREGTSKPVDVWSLST